MYKVFSEPLYSMSDVDDFVKPIIRMSSQHSYLMFEKNIDELLTKPKPVNKPTDTDSDVYENNRNVHVNKLNNKY